MPELPLFGRRADTDDGGGDRILLIGLGNPGDRYARTRHNIGFDIAAKLADEWGMPRARERFNAMITEGRAGPGGPRVAILLPQTYMNESGSAAGPARGSMKVPLDRVVAVHDEIDLPFGEVRTKLGGGVAGHNGLKSLRAGFGDGGFWRVRAGVGRPDTTDPERVAAYVLGRFAESGPEVAELVANAVQETERLVRRIAEGDAVEEAAR